MIHVKVCCISSVEELQMAVAAGVSAVGLVSGMPSGPGVVTDELIHELADLTPPGVSRFLLTPELETEAILQHIQRTGVDVVQICDHVQMNVLEQVRRRSDARVVAVVHVLHEDAMAYAEDAAGVAHAILLDSGLPGAGFLELGGTGRTHDWKRAAAIVERSACPVWLAGGLTPANVAEAIRTVRPFGVDLCTGVRTNKHLDAGKLASFMKEVHRSFP